MKRSTFSGSDMLTGVAALLERYAIMTGDETIARGMCAPWLILRENGEYHAGSQLYRARWINLYLQPLGFRLAEHCLPKGEAGKFLRANPDALVWMCAAKDCWRYTAFSGYSEGRYRFEVIQSADGFAPETLALTGAMLSRRLCDSPTFYVLERCEPATVDFLPLLVESLRTLDAYRADLMKALQQTVTRESLGALHQPLFRALMQEMQPLAAVIDDLILAQELRLLNHDYRHLFTENGPAAVTLYEHIPLDSVNKCIDWMKENVVDQLYAQGLEDEQVEAILGGICT